MKKTLLRFLALSLATSFLLTATAARGQGGADPMTPEEMRREIRALRAQLQALRAAIAEAAEFDRLRANALMRALGSAPGSGEVPAPSRERATEPSPRAAAPRSSAPAAPRAERAPAERAPAERASVDREAHGGGTLRGRVEVPAGEPVSYVYVENVRGPLVKGEKVKIEQKDKAFIPSWAVVQRGTQVEFPNNDNIYHNVFSLSTGNSFDLGLYNSSSEAKGHTFLEPGAVDVFCNIHPKMAASVLVVPNRHFSKVKPDGSFEITGVPSGRRKVVAWAPGSRMSTEWVDVMPGGSAKVTLKLERKTGAHKNKQGQSYGSYE